MRSVVPATQTRWWKAWQFSLYFGVSAVLITIFLVGYVSTPNQNAAWTYAIIFAIWFPVLIMSAYVLGREGGREGRAGPPFPFYNNISAMKFMLGILIVPGIYFISLGLESITGAQVQLDSLLPEVFSRFLPGFSVLETIPIPAWAQVVGWHFGDVSTAESAFQIGAINLLLLGFYKKFSSMKYRMWLSLGVFTLVNGIWTAMHGILSYTALTQFSIAFVAGELLLSLLWILKNPLPTITGHALWNILGALGLLMFWPMITLSVIVIVIIAFLLFLRLRHH